VASNAVSATAAAIATAIASTAAYYGPTNRAFGALDDAGQDALRRDLEQLWTEHNSDTDGTTHYDSEYLEVVAVRE
jgi:hypothetical protein